MNAATISRRKATWNMTATELAKVFADHHNWRSEGGGWISDANSNPICQGWDALAAALIGRGWIKVGSGINWRRAGETPRLARDGKLAF